MIELLRSFNRAIGDLGHLNPILLIDELIATGANGGGTRIGWYADEAATAVRLLRAHGVKTWGYRMAHDPDRRWCKVRHAQAQWAVGLLKGAGYGVFDGPNAPAIKTRSTWGVPAPAQGFAGLLATLIIGGARRQMRNHRGR